jgi:microcystin-dependent protein
MSAAQNASWKFWVVVCSMLFFAAAAVMITQSVFLYDSQAEQDRQIAELGVNLISNVSALQQDDLFIRMNLTQVNMSNMAKIGDLGTETFQNLTVVQNELDVINTLLNISAGNAMTFGDLVSMNFTQVNNTLIDLNLVDSEIIQNLTNLTSLVNVLDAAAIKTINSRPPLANNFQITAGNAGINVIPDTNGIILNNTGVFSVIAGQGVTVSNPNGDVTVENSGILTLNNAGPDATGNFYLSAAGGLDINAGPMLNEITVNATALTNAITNNAMTISTLGTEVTNLTNVYNTQQMEITSISQTLIMLGEMLNGTEMDINMTLTQLIMDVMMLKQQVMDLEAAATQNATGVATGTIVPWGGTAANVPDGYLLCDGSMADVAMNMELFNVIGCQYCGMGASCTTMFCLPDLRGRIPVGQASSGAFMAPINTDVGAETVTLTTPEMPQHNHDYNFVITTSGSDHKHTFMSDAPTAFSDPPAGPQPAQAIHGASAGRPFHYPGGEPVETLPKCGALNGNSYCDGFTGGFIEGSGGSTGSWPTNNAGEHTHSTDDRTMQVAGGNMPHENVQPSKVTAGYMIKT